MIERLSSEDMAPPLEAAMIECCAGCARSIRYALQTGNKPQSG